MAKFGWDNTRSVAQLAERTDLSIERGQESFQFEIGSTVRSSGLGKYKQGTPVTIVDRYEQNGYCYYVETSGSVHRTKDLEAPPVS